MYLKEYEPTKINIYHRKSSSLRVYEYNAFNQLTAYSDGSSSAQYQYNANGLRTKKTVNGQSTGFIWNGTNLAAETSKGSITNTYTYDITGIHSTNQNGTIGIYQKNPHGDITSIVDSSGTKLNTYNYDAFGNETISEETIANPFRYAGEYYDTESDNIYLRARYYTPNIGRFINEDPIQSGLNWYSYCAGNPILYKDPSGLKITCEEENSKTIIELLRELSGNSLDLKYQDGEIIIVKSYDTKNHVGQKLVSDLIDSSDTVNINIGGVEIMDDNGETYMETWRMYNATETDPIQVYIDPDNTLGLGTRGTYVENTEGNVISEDIPNYIHFGHELIHAWREIKGFFLDSVDEVGLIPYDDPHLWREEELQTMGINYKVNGVEAYSHNSYSGTISENGLRLENGLNNRVSYWYAY